MNKSDSVITAPKQLRTDQEETERRAANALRMEIADLVEIGLEVRSSGVDIRQRHAFIDLEPMSVVAAGRLQQFAEARGTELVWSFIYQGFDARIEMRNWCRGITLLITTQTQNFTNVEEARASAR